MTCLYRFQGQTKDNGIIASPGITGFGDIGSAVGTSVNGVTTAYARLDMQTYSMPNRSLRVLRGFDSALGDLFFWDILPSATPWVNPGVYTGPWSCRIYFRMNTNIASMTFIAFREGGTSNVAWTRMYSTDRIARSGTGNAVTLPAANAMYRIEIQADPSRTTKLVWRVYREDQIVAINGFQDAATSVSWDVCRIGSLSAGNFAADQFDIGDVEIHDDYDLGGKFRSSPQDGVTPASANAEGAPSWAEGVSPAFNANSSYVTQPAGEPTVTTYSDVDYATVGGVANRRYDLWVPTGTAPDGGWPLVCWGHSGFFSEGSKLEIPTAWRKDLNLRGYAVASIQYVKAATSLVNPYPAYGVSSVGGRYPSFIVDYKVAVNHLKANAGTTGINPNLVFATGYSAGGYIALAAAMSRDLADDGYGSKLSIAAAHTQGNDWADGSSAADPVFAGAYVYSAPIDMDLARLWDPTYPNCGSLIRRLAYRWFQGLYADGSDSPAYPRQSIANHIALNSLGNLCPVAYERGTADALVHAAHEEALASALGTKGVVYTSITTPNMHDNANKLYRRDDILNWLDAIAYPDTIESKALFHHNGSASTLVDEDFHNGSSVVTKKLYSTQ